jgi:hypothetical protein
MKNEITHFCHKNIIYIIFGVFIVFNIICFPDLLNNRDIKINDYSWIVQQNQYNGHIEATRENIGIPEVYIFLSSILVVYLSHSFLF